MVINTFITPEPNNILFTWTLTIMLTNCIINTATSYNNLIYIVHNYAFFLHLQMHLVPFK